MATSLGVFTPEDIDVLEHALRTLRAVVVRRHRAEVNGSIKDILAGDVANIDRLAVAIRNPRLVSEGK